MLLAGLDTYSDMQVRSVVMAVGGRELSVDVGVVSGQILSLSATSGRRAVVGLSRGGHQALATRCAEACIFTALATGTVVRRPFVLRITLEGSGQTAAEGGRRAQSSIVRGRDGFAGLAGWVELHLVPTVAAAVVTCLVESLTRTVPAVVHGCEHQQVEDEK